LEAAREVQQQLIPLALPMVAGLQFEAAYLPARDVGGDFYQIIPLLDGATLVLIGDVSGKGLKAAMKGVLALGAMRTLAAEGCSPPQLLSRLNHEMLRAPDSGFITCLCLRIERDGKIILANAGHLAPYRNGIELPCECSLPLVPNLEYEQTTIQSKSGDQLTLMTDGVVEATHLPTKELFGFDRTAAISTQSAEEIAAAAKRFGQDDDITVLTVRLAPADIPSENGAKSQSLSMSPDRE
jgi:serine phosphatase RsbU (regulator of sigma subunit)